MDRKHAPPSDRPKSLRLFTPEVSATFVERPNRFTVLCRLDDGSTVRAHSPNPGRMLELLQPDARLLLQRSADPRRKTAYTLVAARRPADGRVVPLVSAAANLLARELVLPRLFPGAGGTRSEVVRAGSRFDFLVQSVDGTRTWVEVKSCTLEAHGVAMFPDAATERGRRHVEELAGIDGDRRMVLFVIQGLKARRFVPDFHNDPAFALALRRAAEEGVEVRAVSVACTPEGVATLDQLEVPVDFTPVVAAEQDVGSYLLHLHVPEPRAVTVGALGRHRFEPGHYLYVGSAMGRLSARIRRHLGRRKKPHWHVDHLRSVSATARAYPIYSLTRLECSLAAEVGALYPQPVAGFGSSDCRCPSHLFYSREDPRRDPRFVELLLRFRHSPAVV